MTHTTIALLADATHTMQHLVVAFEVAGEGDHAEEARDILVSLQRLGFHVQRDRRYVSGGGGHEETHHRR